MTTDRARAVLVKVYEGGTHEVLCDGSRHVWRYGGKLGLSEAEKTVIREGRCDCHLWEDEAP